LSSGTPPIRKRPAGITMNPVVIVVEDTA
jgi:hypothetical protein